MKVYGTNLSTSECFKIISFFFKKPTDELAQPENMDS